MFDVECSLFGVPSEDPRMSLLAQIALRLPDGTAVEHSAAAGIVVALYVALLSLGLLTAIGLAFFFQHRHVDWDERKRLLTARPWRAAEALGMLALLVVMQLATTLLVAAVRKFAHTTPADTTQLVTQTLLLDWLGLALVAALLVWRRLPWHTAFGTSWRSLGRCAVQGTLGFLAVLPFFWFYSALYELGLRWCGIEPELQKVAVTITDEQPLGLRIYLLGVAVAVAPFFEEILFRGIILPVLSKRLGVGRAIIVVAVLFAAVHLHVPALLPLFVMSVAFSLAYLYTGNLLVPVIMHGLFNAFNLALLTALR